LAVDYADKIKEMVQEWYKNGSRMELPPDLKELAEMSGITFNAPTNTHPTTPSRQGKREKDNAITPTARDGAVQDSLDELRFVISGVWPDLAGCAGLKIGKERVRAHIKQFGGKVTLAISDVTDVLVIGEKPGPKKLIEALEKGVKVIDIDILNHLIRGELTLNKVRMLTAPDVEAPVHAVDHQVQRQSQTPTPTEQAHEGTAGPKGDPEFDHRNE
jgi:NAD-dependent DNA ligase